MDNWSIPALVLSFGFSLQEKPLWEELKKEWEKRGGRSLILWKTLEEELNREMKEEVPGSSCVLKHMHFQEGLERPKIEVCASIHGWKAFDGSLDLIALRAMRKAMAAVQAVPSGA